MAIKKYKPTTPGRRGASSVDYSKLAKKPKAPKKLLKAKAKSGGRNRHGHITVRHMGGGSRKKVRVIDNRRDDKLNVPAKIQSLEYDPNRSAFLALLVYQDGDKRYIVAPHKAKVGQRVIASEKKVEMLPGNRTRLGNFPAGTIVHDVELTKGKGGQMARSAGSYATVMATEKGYTNLKLPSGEIRKVQADNLATVGQVSNVSHSSVRLGKAGRSRRMGKRPSVRGKAMNPVDHPHGGGEGRSPVGLKYPKTPWGKHALGVKTRKKKKESDKFIIQRRKKKRKKK